MAKNRPLRPGETAPVAAPARPRRPNRPNNPGGGGKKKRNRGPGEPAPPETFPGQGYLNTPQRQTYIDQNQQPYLNNRLGQGGLTANQISPFGQFLGNDFYTMADQYFQNYKQNVDSTAGFETATNAMAAPFADGRMTANPYTSSSAAPGGDALANMARYRFLALSPQARGEGQPGMTGGPGRWSPWG
jgi:hypothetical protein